MIVNLSSGIDFSNLEQGDKLTGKYGDKSVIDSKKIQLTYESSPEDVSKFLKENSKSLFLMTGLTSSVAIEMFQRINRKFHFEQIVKGPLYGLSREELELVEYLASNVRVSCDRDFKSILDGLM